MRDGKQWVYFFGDPVAEGSLGAKDLLGGKGASLAEMTRANLHVPPGFTISAECCGHFFENEGRWPEGLEDQVRNNLKRLEETTGRTFARGKQPLLVSVRSGAAVSMPGMMDTILNCGLHPGLAAEVGDSPRFWQPFLQFMTMFASTVHGIEPRAFTALVPADADQPVSRARVEQYMDMFMENTGSAFPTDPWAQLVECVNAVFRSWNSERAIAYRWRNDIRGLLGTAVNVQAMFPSHVSGVLFTQDPNNLAAEQMVVESSYGLGEAVVSGDVDPDRFIVKRDGLTIVESVVGKKLTAITAFGDTRTHDKSVSSLTPGQIVELSDLALCVEKHFGAPVDIEWGWAEGQFALLQCRPIRGLDVARDVEVGRQEEIARLRQLAADKRRIWVAHNLGETLRSPTPLTWDIVRRFMSGSGGYGLMYRDFGYRPSPRVCEAGFLELIGGRAYADPDRLAEMFWCDMPLSYDLDSVVKDKRQLDRAPTQFDPNKASGRFILKLPGTIVAILRSAHILKRTRKNAKTAFDEEILPPYLEYVRQKRGQDLAASSTPELIAELDARCRRVLDDFGKESLKPGFFGAMAYASLEQMLVQLLGKDEGGELARTLTMGLEGDVTFEQDALLYRVTTGESSMDAFLERFGHRAAGEMELMEPRWREDQTYLEQIVALLRGHTGRPPHETHEENVARRREVESELPQTLARAGGRSVQHRIEADLADARTLLPYRENGKYYLMMGYELIRVAVLELARRWELGNDIFFLQIDELKRFERDRAQLVEAIAKRKTRWQSLQKLDMPDVIDSTNLDTLGLPPELEAAEELQGDAVASGVATGPARIVLDPRNPGDLGVDYILVCPSTDPGWTPLFMNARGLVVERGGVLSHGAIVARDFGIPAVVCPNATRLIAPGATVRVDGNRGRISLVSQKE